MTTNIRELLKKYIDGTITPEELKILEEKARQYGIMQQIINDRAEWIDAMIAYQKANENKESSKDDQA